MNGVSMRRTSLAWQTLLRTASHDEIRRQPKVVPARSGPTLLGANRYRGQRVSRYAQECGQPVHPPVDCSFVSPSIYIRFPLLGLFRGADRAGKVLRRGSLRYGYDPDVARVCSVVWAGKKLLRINYRPFYTSTASISEGSCQRGRPLINAH